MTGAEHYAEAERLLLAASYFDADPSRARGASSRVREASLLTAQAQVHATLALAAATVLSVRVLDRDGGGYGYAPGGEAS